MLYRGVVESVNLYVGTCKEAYLVGKIIKFWKSGRLKVSSILKVICGIIYCTQSPILKSEQLTYYDVQIKQTVFVLKYIYLFKYETLENK